jgi:hypothetical protein
MRKLFTLFLLLIIGSKLFASFDEHFLNKTLRIDYFHTGDWKTEIYSIDRLIEEPFWGGTKTNLIDPFDYGKYRCKVYDLTTNMLIFSYSYSTLFSEWQTTAESKKITSSFPETVLIPYPKNKVRVEFNTRNNKGVFESKYVLTVDPADYFIQKENKFPFPFFDILNNGDPAKKVDIVFIPEGYTKDQMPKFRKDCQKFSDYLFKVTPYKQNKDKFNIRGIEAPSLESGTDFPGLGKWKNTIINSSFYTFDTERYLMTKDNTTLRYVASNVPYDQIVIIVNTDHYGGGAIYNHYAICVSDNDADEYVFTHEFGHSFAGLGDEYYDSETSYNDFYPVSIEPWEPNLTTLVNFETKWKSLIIKDTPVPTPNDEKYAGVTGVFEGGGYVTKGVYRPAYDCSMKSNSVDHFCPVCRNAIIKMIGYYTE